MKKQEQRTEFIRLRAEGRSLRAIAEEIGVSKSTLSEWEKELRAEVDRLRAENLEELYSSYGMAKEARIRRIGETLRRIDTALDAVDLSALSPEKLLDYKLKYQAALKEEYKAGAGADVSGEAGDTLEALRSLYRRASAGDTSLPEAKIELAILDHVVDGYERANPFDMFMK